MSLGDSSNGTELLERIGKFNLIYNNKEKLINSD